MLGRLLQSQGWLCWLHTGCGPWPSKKQTNLDTTYSSDSWIRGQKEHTNAGLWHGGLAAYLQGSKQLFLRIKTFMSQCLYEPTHLSFDHLQTTMFKNSAQSHESSPEPQPCLDNITKHSSRLAKDSRKMCWGRQWQCQDSSMDGALPQPWVGSMRVKYFWGSKGQHRDLQECHCCVWSQRASLDFHSNFNLSVPTSTIPLPSKHFFS